jgi:two-component system response regulator PhoP
MRDVRHWVLVVLDDQVIRDEMLIPGLESAGFNAVGVGTAVDAYRCMLARNFSLFVLDSGLPDADGLTLADRLRTVTDAGIVVLTEQRRRKGGQMRSLNNGADAYLTKPIDVDVLTAKLRSLLRRLKPLGASRVASKRPSSWRLGAAGWDLISPDGVKVPLTQPERLLIGALAASSGKTVARDAIISLLARDAKNFDRHRLEMLVHRLRRKVLSATRQPLPLKAVRGVGYALVI